MIRPYSITFLGGLGEIGRNCMLIDGPKGSILIDCGLMFPYDNMIGVDLIIPNFEEIRNRKKIDGVLLTHAHEDHIGALSYLLAERELRLYGSDLTLGIASSRIRESGMLKSCELISVEDYERRRVGDFDVEFLPVTHSVPGSFAIVLHTEFGAILHTGDFKIDLTPIDGRRSALNRIGEIARTEGIHLLLSDSTNAEKKGWTDSEKSVKDSLLGIFLKRPNKRIVVTCFSSHIHRISEVIEISKVVGRRVAIVGKSIERTLEAAKATGRIRYEHGDVIDSSSIDKFPDNELCVITTGSQGEPLSALSNMARGKHKNVKIGPNDTVILSSSPVPGNEVPVSRVLDNLALLGAEVIHSETDFVHASGHGRQNELLTMLTLCEPTYFIPIHGQFRHLSAHADIARQAGVKNNNVLVFKDGDCIEIGQDVRLVNVVDVGYVYVEGSDIDSSDRSVKERQELSREGFIAIIITVSGSALKSLSCEIVTRGLNEDGSNKKFFSSLQDAVLTEVNSQLNLTNSSREVIMARVKALARKKVSAELNKKPLIIPVLVYL